jgi:hypothetical protein
MLNYTVLDNIKERLQTRMFVDTTGTGTVSSIGGQQVISYNLMMLSAGQVEEWMDSYLRLLYTIPLQQPHPILNAVAEKLIISDILSNYYEGTVGLSNDQGLGNTSRQQALDLFQSLFMGTGIIIVGAAAVPQNNPNQQQLQVRFIPLIGETLNTSIGAEGQDTQLWNTTETPQGYYVGRKSDFSDDSINTVDRSRTMIDFYHDRYDRRGMRI